MRVKHLATLTLVDPVALAVPVAAQVARALQAPLDGLMVREIDEPGPSPRAVAAVVEPPDVAADRRCRLRQW